MRRYGTENSHYEHRFYHYRLYPQMLIVNLHGLEFLGMNASFPDPKIVDALIKPWLGWDFSTGTIKRRKLVLR